MPELTRRSSDAREECWHVYYGGVLAGTIAIRSGNPRHEDPWEWHCGFYPGCHPREHQGGTAATFDEASADLLATIPGLTIFRDRLVMEHRRATTVQQPLSLLAIELKPSSALAGTGEVEIAFGDAAKTLTGKLRGEDSVFLLAPGIFGVVLPGVSAAD